MTQYRTVTDGHITAVKMRYIESISQYFFHAPHSTKIMPVCLLIVINEVTARPVDRT